VVVFDGLEGWRWSAECNRDAIAVTLPVVTRFWLLKWSLRTSAGSGFNSGKVRLRTSRNSLTVCCCRCVRFVAGGGVDAAVRFLVFGGMMVQVVGGCQWGVILQVARTAAASSESLLDC